MKLAIDEDCPHGDRTVSALRLDPFQTDFRVIAKQDGVLAGGWLWDFVRLKFGNEADASLGASWAKKADGIQVRSGDVIIAGKGAWDWILKWERTILNLMATMSGIATETARYVAILKEANSTAHISETRKILPGLRDLAKYSVSCGGGINHRRDLSAGVLLKENHLSAAGGILQTIERLRMAKDQRGEWEVELATEDQVNEISELKRQNRIPPALKWVMLDNFPPDSIARSLPKLRGFSIELSGGITLANLATFALFPVHRISVGALTHSVRAFDFSLLIDGEQVGVKE